MKRCPVLVSVFLLALSVSEAQNQASAEAELWDVAVIGGGGGGLAAAARLAQAGLKVVLLEQHIKVGGYMTNFRRGDYTFEVSLHAVSGFNEGIGGAKPLFKTLGILDKVEPLKLDIPYRVVLPGLELEVPADPREYQSRLRQHFPTEKEGIDRLFKMLGNIEYLLKAQQGKAGPVAVDDPAWPFRKYARVSAAAMLDDFIKDKRLVSVFSWLRGYCGTPLNKLPATLLLGMWSSYHFDGYYYFRGGSQAVSNALGEVIEKSGGTIKLGALATKIVIENGGAVAVQTKDGDLYRCRYVISNASAPATLNRLVGREHLPPEYLARLDQMEIGPSILQVFLGVDRDYTKEFGGAHTISLFKTEDYLEETRFWKEGDVENLSFFIVNYSVTEAMVAPAGKNVIVFTAYMPYEWKDGWYENASYEKYLALKQEVATVLIRRAEEVLPELSSHIEVMEVGSPRTMEHYTLNPKGAVYGWAVDMKHSGPGRLAQETPIPNLLLAGVWTRSGHGQIAALNSGNEAAEKIIDQFRQQQ
jgi:prolycopene isomerase